MYACVRACRKLTDLSKTGPCEWAEMMRDCVYVCVCMYACRKLSDMSKWVG
jgi:hypothetical protein